MLHTSGRVGYLCCSTEEEYAQAITEVLAMDQVDRLQIAAAARRCAAMPASGTSNRPAYSRVMAEIKSGTVLLQESLGVLGPPVSRKFLGCFAHLPPYPCLCQHVSGLLYECVCGGIPTELARMHMMVNTLNDISPLECILK